MIGVKNDFSVSYWLNGRRTFFLEYVHDTRYSAWMVYHKYGFKFEIYRVYNRRTRQYITTVKTPEYAV